MFGAIAPDLRSAQSPVEPEHRPLLALANHPAGAAGCRRPNPRPLHRHGRPGPGLRPGGRGARADRRCRFLSRDAERAVRKTERRRAADRIRFVEADAQQLPFPDDTFQIATVAFGLRNVTDTDRGIAEMVRVTRPGGRVAILEFSQPRLAVRPAVSLLFPPHPAVRRPDLVAQPGQCLPLPAGQRAWSSPTARPWPNAFAVKDWWT